ncbi:hypothetical protein [Pontivivens insulae]|uniref:Heme oxygenase n=1 Tax=Pontivivens insulae TaxID=1639689 RepID=A0A2R8A7G4_9RHOB|nr:hypothetical protein [Pontivivens insulae]RED18071.1 heme oxygenase [Pontivivens insulae]SPF27968.1 hypothetical protein POI8812_00263 [Pontivivens insulae]
MTDAANEMTLRSRLRGDTMRMHIALDERVSAFDLACSDGLRAYLWMQAAGLVHVCSGPLSHPVHVMVDDLLLRAKSDLAALEAPDLPHANPHNLDQLATAYVLCGSRLGNSILKRRWQSGAVGRPEAYFSAPSYIELWRAFVAEASAQPAFGHHADRVVTDANALFGTFLSLAEDAARHRVKAHV